MPDYEVQDPQTGRTLVMTGDKPPEQADIDAAFAAKFDRPGFLSRAVPSAKAAGAGLLQLGKAASGDENAIRELFGGMADVMSEGTGIPRGGFVPTQMPHPIKAAERFVGIDPDNLWNDARALNVPAVLGDVAVPVGTLALPKVLHEALPEAKAAVGRVQAARAARAAAQPGKTYMENLGKAIGPTGKTLPIDAANKARAMPYLVAEHEVTPIETEQGLMDAADTAAGKIDAQVKGYVAPVANTPLPANPMQAAAIALRGMKGLTPDDIAAGLAELKKWGLDNPNQTMGRAMDLITRFNAEDKAVLKKNQWDKATARGTDAGFLVREAAAAEMRRGVFEGLDQLGTPGVADLRKAQGSLMAIREATAKNVFKGEKAIGGQQELGLPSRVTRTGIKMGTGAALLGGGFAVGGSLGLPQLGSVLGVSAGVPLGELLARKIVPNVTRDELIRRAFENLKAKPPQYPPGPTVPPPPQPVGALPPGPVVPAPPPGGSYVRGVPAFVQPSTGARQLPGRQGIPLPAVPDRSGLTVTSAHGTLEVDPRTGQARPVYTSESGQAPSLPVTGSVSESGAEQPHPPDEVPRVRNRGGNAARAGQSGPEGIPAEFETDFRRLHTAAKAKGFSGTLGQLAEHFRRALDEAKAIVRESSVSEEQTGSRSELLKAISDAGGIGLDAEPGMHGEVSELMDALHGGAGRKPTVRYTKAGKEYQIVPPRPSAGIPGAPGIFKGKGNGGYPLDTIFQSVLEDGRFSHIESVADFLEEIRKAVFEHVHGSGSPAVNAPSIRSTLKMLGVSPENAWWEEQPAPEFDFGENKK